MASIGLKINDGGGIDTGLADTLAKAYFGDPDQAAKIALARAHIASQGAYATKLDADTGLVTEKTREQKMRDDAAAAAGGPTGDALAVSVPMPVPVDAPRPSPTFQGPMPAIVKPEDQASYAARVRAAHALGPLIVTSPGNPAQIAEGVSRSLGTFGVIGQTDPNKARVDMGLATDKLPTTDTVVISGDNAGQNAVAQKDIAVERAKAQLPQLKDIPGRGLVSVTGTTATPVVGGEAPAFGATDKGLQQTIYTNLKAKLDQGQPLTPVEKAQFEEAAAAVSKDNSVTPIEGKKGTTLYTRDPTNPNKLIPMEGQAAPETSDGAFGDQTTVEGISAKTVSNTSVKMQDAGFRPSPQEALDYATSYNHLYGPKQNFEKDAQGNINLITTNPEPPPGVLTPQEVFARVPGFKLPQASQAPQTPASGPPPVGAPPAPPIVPTAPVASPSPGAPPTAAPNAGDEPVPKELDNAAASLVPNGNVRVQRIVTGGSKPLTESQGKDRTFLARALMGSAYLDQMQKGDVPSIWSNYIANPESTGIASAFMQAGLDPDTKNLVTARTAFDTAQLRKESGAAINPSEFRQADVTFSPNPNDGPEQLAYKTEQRHAFMRSLIDTAYNTPEEKAAAIKEAADMGVDLKSNPKNIPKPKSARGAAPAAPVSSIPAPAGFDPKTWSHLKPEEQQQYLDAK